MFRACRVRISVGIPITHKKKFRFLSQQLEKISGVPKLDHDHVFSNYIILILPFDVTGLYSELLIGYTCRKEYLNEKVTVSQIFTKLDTFYGRPKLKRRVCNSPPMTVISVISILVLPSIHVAFFPFKFSPLRIQFYFPPVSYMPRRSLLI